MTDHDERTRLAKIKVAELEATYTKAEVCLQLYECQEKLKEARAEAARLRGDVLNMNET